MTDTLTDFKVMGHHIIDPPRQPGKKGGTYISAFVDNGTDRDLIQGVCPDSGAISEIVLFTGKFNGKPVVGGLFVCENETKIINCEIKHNYEKI